MLHKSLKTYLKKDTYTLEDLNAIVTTDQTIGRNKMIMSQIITNAGPDFAVET